MRILFRIIPLCMLLLGFVACDDEDEAKVETLEVTPANLNGTWQLVEWNGESLAEGTYCYITFVRRDKTFQMYQKFDSMYARFFSGTFEIEKDDDLGGRWNNSYVVTDLLPSGSMIWTVKDDMGDVSKYVRCDGVPSDIVEETEVDTGN